MSMLWAKLVKFSVEFKQVCVEQLWLIALLCPLLLLLGVGATHLHDKNSASSANRTGTKQSEQLVKALISQEISSAEVAEIVAKPIGELLAMQVYFDEATAQSGDNQPTRLVVEDVFRNDESNKILTHRSRRMPSGMLTYNRPLNNKKTQKVADHT